MMAILGLNAIKSAWYYKQLTLDSNVIPHQYFVRYIACTFESWKRQIAWMTSWMEFIIDTFYHAWSIYPSTTSCIKSYVIAILPILGSRRYASIKYVMKCE